MKPDPFYVQFGKIVRRHRRRLDLNQVRLAEKMGLARTSITSIENGRQQVLLHHLFGLAKSLETSPEALISEIKGSLDAPAEINHKLEGELQGAEEKKWAYHILGPVSKKKGGVTRANAKQ